MEIELLDQEEKEENKTLKNNLFSYFEITDYSNIDASAIKKLRKRLNLSEKSFAEILGVTPETIDSWENNTNVPKTTTLRLLYLLIKNPELLFYLCKIKKSKETL